MASLTLAQRRERYADEYRRRWAAAEIDPDKVDTVFAVAKRIMRGRAVYETISARTDGVPWWWIGITHNREGSCNFGTHLHNGDPLTARTKNVPAGRPPVGNPPFDFIDSAVDALTMPGKRYQNVERWDVVEVFFRFEQYNGFGYREQGIPSPYLWAMTNQSNERGKYIRDHVFDPNAPEKQVGCAAIMLALRKLGVDLFPEDKFAREARNNKVRDAVASVGGAVATTAAATGTLVAQHPPAGWSSTEIYTAVALGVVVVLAGALIVYRILHRKGS